MAKNYNELNPDGVDELDRQNDYIIHREEVVGTFLYDSPAGYPTDIYNTLLRIYGGEEKLLQKLRESGGRAQVGWRKIV